MNIYDLGRDYIQRIPYDDEDLGLDELIFEVDDVQGYRVEYRGYEGYMARYDMRNTFEDRPKLGYFDIRIKDRRRRLITHRDLLENLIQYSNLDNCFDVWLGYNIEDIAEDEREMEVLTGLALCMLEQDINWGPNIWQKFTHFGNRGRDMIMGFINYAFNEGIENIPHWRGNTPTFGQELRPGSEEFNEYFVFEDNPRSILSEDIFEEFDDKIMDKDDNPNEI